MNLFISQDSSFTPQSLHFIPPSFCSNSFHNLVDFNRLFTPIPFHSSHLLPFPLFFVEKNKRNEHGSARVSFDRETWVRVGGGVGGGGALQYGWVNCCFYNFLGESPIAKFFGINDGSSKPYTIEVSTHTLHNCFHCFRHSSIPSPRYPMKIEMARLSDSHSSTPSFSNPPFPTQAIFWGEERGGRTGIKCEDGGGLNYCLSWVEI